MLFWFRKRLWRVLLPLSASHSNIVPLEPSWLPERSNVFSCVLSISPWARAMAPSILILLFLKDKAYNLHLLSRRSGIWNTESSFRPISRQLRPLILCNDPISCYIFLFEIWHLSIVSIHFDWWTRYTRCWMVLFLIGLFKSVKTMVWRDCLQLIVRVSKI